MKHLKLTVLAFLVFFATSCKDNKKDGETSFDNSTDLKEKYVAKSEATSVKWTAYKTTDKTPVGGQFTFVNFDNKEGATPEEALNGIEFSIPIKSLFTNDDDRDAKIKEFFFGAMLNTEVIAGKINYSENKYSASITMNGETNDIPLEVNITDQRRVKMSGVMQLKDWNALDALASLNKVCFELHKGADGVSKTWEEVAIEVDTYLRDKN